MNQVINMTVVLEYHEYFIPLFQQFKDIALANLKEKFQNLSIDIESSGNLNIEEISNLPSYQIPDKNDDASNIIEAKIEDIPYFIPFGGAKKNFHFKGTICFQRFDQELHLMKKQGKVELIINE